MNQTEVCFSIIRFLLHRERVNALLGFMWRNVDSVSRLYRGICGTCFNVGDLGCCPGAVLVLGFANLFADGISMGFGDYLSSTAERDFSANQQLVADWEVENDFHGEMLELVSAYEEQGMAKGDADQVSSFFPLF